MNEKIIQRINTLGGNTDAVSRDKNFFENWRSISFNHHLYDKDWDVYGIDKFHDSHKELYQNDREKFFENLIEHYFSNHEQPYGQYFVKDWLFTPFKENTEDYGELDGFVEENELKEIIDGSKMELLCIFYFYGYPDHFFVCTTDPDQSNPKVYSTDHEVYFEEIENKGNMETFLDRFMTKEEFREVVTEYLGGKLVE
ncbi:hypothetical protein C1637_14100 [Chryseobacterium lactis]|uniref:SMI1/KNR4 family protein n=1 Tax=Chryseobacterium lactis TaxID=1241981 RepID=A0A3G6RGF5_CHRLC|nr:hypothetical protein [Chryseobacterium lactis]AZA83747.1 hypothetical protein EG342_18465 [Chryseobacterium lactis]AZB04132.1 hypothetical protein EG341_09340 [Chryseobacterium lactis]PNW12960.1 hypothetical protein C1637_14100 [Chryseobacterium lactis]